MGKLSSFEAALVAALKTDAHRVRDQRRTARALFVQIQAQGYRGGYSAVTDFIRTWRQDSGKDTTKAFVPLSFELGEAFQFDWSEEGIVVGGVYHQAQVAHLKLCASRAFWLVVYPSQGHERLFDAHTRSFAALGGVARRGIYDNMKTAVDKVKKGKGRVVNARFAAMCSHYLFDADFCNVASGWEKGVVEKNVQDSRPATGVAGSARAQVHQLCRTQRVAGRALQGGVGGHAAPAAPGAEHRRGAAARARAPHGHAGAV